MQKRRKTIFISLLLVIFLGVFSGCGMKSQEDAAPSNSLKKMTVGYSPAGGSGLLTFIALNQDYFKEAGLDVELVPFTSTADGLNALNSGKIDLGIGFGTAGPLTLDNNGADLVIIGGSLAGGHPIIATQAKADMFKSIEDYKGKTVASPRLYTSDIVFRGALAKAGIDVKKDLDIIEMKNPNAVLEAVKSGKVDVGIGTTAVYATAKSAGLAIVGWSNDFFPDHPCCRVVTTSTLLKDDPQRFQAFLEGIIRAEKVRAENPELAVEINNTFLKLDKDAIKEFTLEPHQITSSDPNRKGVIKMFNEMAEMGYIEPKINPDNYINTDLYQQAISKIEKTYPDDAFFKSLGERFEKQNLT